MRGILALVAVAALVATLPLANAQATTEITITGKAQGCPAGKTYCLEVTSGSLANVEPGSTLTITFVNEDQGSPHNLYVVTSANKDADHKNTATAQALGHTDPTIDPNGEETFTVSVPSDAEGLYFWCDVAGHEQLGMWMEQSFGGETTSENGGGASPAPALVLAILGALGVALVLRRRE